MFMRNKTLRLNDCKGTKIKCQLFSMPFLKIVDFLKKNNSLIAPTEIEEAAPKTRQKRGTFCIKISAVGPNDLIFFQ